MVADLIEQNLARDPARRACSGRSVAVLDAPDADVTVFLRIARDDVRVGDGDVPDAHVRIRTNSERLLDLTTAPLRFGLPDPSRPEGRAIVADLLRRRIRIRGLLRHPLRLARLTKLLSVADGGRHRVTPRAPRDAARPDAPAGTGRPIRRWLPTALVALVMSFTVLGGFVVAGALPEPAVRALALGGVLTIHPLPGWEVVLREAISIPSTSGASCPLSSPSSRAVAARSTSSPCPASAAARSRWPTCTRARCSSSQLERLSVSDRVEEIVLRNGLQAVRFSYIGSEPQSGSPIEGSVTVVVSPSGNGVVFDGWGFQGQLELIVEELAVMIDNAEVA